MKKQFKDIAVNKLPLAITAIIFLVSISVTVMAFTLPNEIEEQITVLNYEHQGRFDYLVYQEASYLFGDMPLETDEDISQLQINPPSIPQYPAEMIDHFEITFAYRFVPDRPVTRVSEEVEIVASLLKPEGEWEDVILVPLKLRGGDFTVNFSLRKSHLESSEITIEAKVYTTVETDTGPVFESFTQELTIRRNGPYFEVDQELTSSQQVSFGELNYEQIGEFDYSIHLKPDSPFGAITLKPPPVTPPIPPPPPPPPSSKILRPGDTIFFNLFDRMDATFAYNFKTDRPVNQIVADVEINAILENQDIWRKTFVLVPPTEKSGDFTVTFSLDTDDFSQFSDVFTTIEEETGVSVSGNLTIQANVHTVAQTPFGTIDEEFTQTLSTTLGNDILEWEEELVESKAGAIEMSRVIPNPNKGRPIIAGLGILGMMIAVTLYAVWSYRLAKARRVRLPVIDEWATAVRLEKKHQDIIVEVEDLPPDKLGTLIPIDSLGELVKVADALLKPVLHKAEQDIHIYYVIDGLTRYKYVGLEVPE